MSANDKYEIFRRDITDFLSFGDELSHAIYVIDKNGVIVDANKHYEDIAGLKREELIGMSMQDLWDEKIYTTEEAFVEMRHKDKMPSMGAINRTKKDLQEKKPKSIGLMVLKAKKKLSIVTRIERKDMTVIITGIPYFDENGKVEWVVTVMRDISEITDLKEKLEDMENDKEVYLNELKYLRKKQMGTDLVGASSGIEKIRELINQVSKTDVTVLITGESGVGKEVVAREIYKNSLRKNGPYIKVNCASIPGNLLESELFGYENGAFTGAQQKGKPGLFELANHGTILLDEIGEMPILLQAKLLRVIQEKEFIRVGGTNPIKLDIRIIAATNQDLQEQIKEGKFREDLYYRLNVVPVRVLPLRERREDIPVLAYHFLEKANKKYNRHKNFQKGAIERLEYYDWPGNIRELENIIQRLVIINDNKSITKNDTNNALGKDMFISDLTHDSSLTLKDAVNLFEKDIIEKTLKKCGSTYKAADILGVNQSTIVKKAKTLGISEW